ncbi:hypothetical protein E2C01_071902 [Portunus trituberculatus]|uniref:Uncharacterized protein n=1 Tax=Portunus trituberculatus TaxID=210409 RepID=A0A5B7I7H5_PORTR|nr:hypothetical protein [Portunus trituberculatus]
MRSATDEAETHGDSATSSSSCDPFSLAIEEWKHKHRGESNTQAKRVTRRRRSDRVDGHHPDRGLGAILE